MESNAYEECGYLWSQVHREWSARFRRSFNRRDMPDMFGLIAMRLVARHPGITVSELARRGKIAKSHVSDVVDQLVRRGQLRKESDPRDQRLVRIFLGDQGERSMKDSVAKMRAAWATVLDRLDESEVEDVNRGLRALLKALQKGEASE